MDDKTLVLNYITTHYNVVLGDRVNIRGISDDTPITMGTLHTEIENIFGFDGIDTTNDWFEDRLYELTKGINDYLNTYKVIHGPTNWIVQRKFHKEGDFVQYFSLAALKREFKGDYGEKIIDNMFNEWYIKQIYTETDNYLNINH